MFRKSVAAASILGSATMAALALTAAPSVAAGPAPQSTSAASAQQATVQQVSQGKHRAARFEMARAAGVVRAGCLPEARAKVEVISGGEAETMNVWVSGLPAHTEFDFFVLQVPDAPFGLSWYQGDIETDKYGRGQATYRGRFNEETFSVAVGAAPAPVTHEGDADTNPVTRPVHQYHLGFWFNSPADADEAGCGALVTPFNGEHNAGTQAMSTRNFPADAGPLSRIKS